MRRRSSVCKSKRAFAHQDGARSRMGSIRFLLALAVVTAHVTKLPFHLGVNSLLAVQGFYAISGFLIAFVWDVKYSRGPNAIRSFYANRAARIYFMYWAVL